jgi:hypothetical protein
MPILSSFSYPFFLSTGELQITIPDLFKPPAAAASSSSGGGGGHARPAALPSTTPLHPIPRNCSKPVVARYDQLLRMYKTLTAPVR